MQLIPRSSRMQEKSEQPIARLRDEFDALLERLFHPETSRSQSQQEQNRLGDEIEVEDRSDELVVRTDVPGFEPNEIDVEFSNGFLTVRAEKQQVEQKKGNGNAEERVFRAVQRSVMLPPGINWNKVEARYRNGLLEIHLPKSEDAKPKRISVRN